MKRTDAQKAIDDGFAEGLKRLFGLLVQNMEGQNTSAVANFRRGVAFHDEAYSTASGIIETIFKDET